MNPNILGVLGPGFLNQVPTVVKAASPVHIVDLSELGGYGANKVGSRSFVGPGGWGLCFGSVQVRKVSESFGRCHFKLWSDRLLADAALHACWTSWTDLTWPVTMLPTCCHDHCS